MNSEKIDSNETEKAIETFILEKVNAGLADGVPKLAKASTVRGVVDVSRHHSKVICSIMSLSEGIEEGNINGIRIRTNILVTFLFQGDKYEQLYKWMNAYSDAFRIAMIEDSDLAEEGIYMTIAGVEKHPDTGATPFAMTAAEIHLDVLTDEYYD